MDTIRMFLVDYGEFWQENAGIMIMVLIGAAVVIGSGCLAGSIAELRNRSRLLHTLIGFAIPLVYPGIILFSLSYRESGRSNRMKAEKQEKIVKVEGAPPADAPPVLNENDAPPVVNEELLGQSKLVYDQIYFKQVMYDEKGNYRGPFHFVVNGDEFKVERVVTALDNVVVIENISSDGKTQHLRIPYARIESCTEQE